VAVPKAGRGEQDRPSGRLPRDLPLDDEVTELRVHGVGGTTPEALLDDLAPEQVGGDRLAGFYRTADLRRGRRVRHVEAYSWGGLTSRSAIRVLWLVLLPFMLANVAGWMYRGAVRSDESPDGDRALAGARFACHRVASSLVSLALTVNTVLVGILIAPNLLAYQASRAGQQGHWWLWPLSWTWVHGHGERPLFIGYLAVAIVIGLLAVLGFRSQDRYERVRPPWRIGADGTSPDRPVTSAADVSLADRRFWDSALAVRRLTAAHLGAAGGFLAIVFAITAKAAAGGPPRGLAWWWLAMVIGGIAVAVAVAIVVTDHWADRIWPRLDLSSGPLRIGLQCVAPAAVVCASVFAFLQPTMRIVPGSLPGLNAITAATYIAIAVTLIAIGLVDAAGLIDRQDNVRDTAAGGGLFAGPAVVLLLATGLLNAMLLGVLFTAGNATCSQCFEAQSGRQAITLPLQLAWAGPVLGATFVVGFVGFGIVELIRMRTGAGVSPAEVDDDVAAYSEGLLTTWPKGSPDRTWVVAEVDPPVGTPTEQAPPADDPATRQAWHRQLRRSYWLGDVRRVIGPLLRLLVGLQVVSTLVIVIVRPPVPDAGYSPQGALAQAFVFAATAVFAGMVWLVWSGWRDSAERKRISMLWDVGTFWPRSYHPLAPPCYAERAVPDLQRRIWRLNDHGSPVLLVAHSQGTILAAAALLQQNCRAARGRIGVATFGAPLSRLYGWAFPAYFNTEVRSGVGERRPDRATVLRWRNFYYPTDPIGGPITDGAQGTDCLPSDTRLLDPAVAWRIYGDPVPTPGGHSGYWTDDRVWAGIDAIGEEIR
jgi:hypothetical protein